MKQIEKAPSALEYFLYCCKHYFWLFKLMFYCVLYTVQQRQILQLNRNSSLQMTLIIEETHWKISLLIYSKCARLSEGYTGYKMSHYGKGSAWILNLDDGRTLLAGTKAISESQSL